MMEGKNSAKGAKREKFINAEEKKKKKRENIEALYERLKSPSVNERGLSDSFNLGHFHFFEKLAI